MTIDKPLQRAILLRRYKRFLAEVKLESGEIVTVHCPNPGSMLGCNKAGSAVIISDSGNPRRKLRWTLEMVHTNGTWVGVHPNLANDIVVEAIEQGWLPELSGYAAIEREIKIGSDTRIDLRLADHPAKINQACYVEIKNVTLVVNGTALFPDAQTARGRKHLRKLAKIAAAGQRAVMTYCIPHGGAERFAPAAMIDPEYAEILTEVHARGVEILPYVANVKPDGEIRLVRRVPLSLELSNLPDMTSLIASC
ncbi:MAG: DNA/RNA nuclease SfsA [candidate division KSB1 bacterium]|nr:DNA/RNA nuclease SfsA [candidate division KSB1 bacterium]MDZ7303121.1 DNA/RNA nuclease SfsA [candidate division KSB1 bacterium]MDZ7310102.1 DNA/RNA nuclease SfsA [candidate division KSB1 bacterium]